jgi:hypothetical protein
MSYVNTIICVRPLPFLETWPPIYRGQERTVRDRLKASQVYSYVYFRYTPCLTDFTFEFIRRPTPPILSPSYWTFVELTLVTLSQPTVVSLRWAGDDSQVEEISCSTFQYRKGCQTHEELKIFVSKFKSKNNNKGVLGFWVSVQENKY